MSDYIRFYLDNKSNLVNINSITKKAEEMKASGQIASSFSALYITKSQNFFKNLINGLENKKTWSLKEIARLVNGTKNSSTHINNLVKVLCSLNILQKNYSRGKRNEYRYVSSYADEFKKSYSFINLKVDKFIADGKKRGINSIRLLLFVLRLLKSSGKKQIENITIGVIAKKLAMSSQQVSRALKQLESNKDISIDIKVKENRHQALARLFNISVDINKFIYDYKDDPWDELDYFR